MTDTDKDLVAKLLSGRLWLTLACAFVFIYVSVNKILPEEAIASIITMVFLAYFERRDRSTKGGV